jgi:glycosyltransferase involved in cell wall biosynthesis
VIPRSVDDLVAAWHRFEERHTELARYIRPPAKATYQLIRRWRWMGPIETLGSMVPGRDRPPERGTILLIDDMAPQFDRNAGAVFMFGTMRLLTESGFRVIFLPDNRAATQPYTAIIQGMGVEVLYGRFDVPRWLASPDCAIDWALVARPDIALRYIPAIRAGTQARLLYYTHDLHYLREQRQYQTTGDRRYLRRSEGFLRQETEVFQLVDCVTTPSTDEVSVIEGLVPGREVRVLTPWVGRLNNGPEASEHELALERRDHLLFVGGFQHPPNVDAAQFLVSEVMPLVWERVPRAQLWIAGSDPPAEVLQLQGGRISVLGYVPDLWPYYLRARASVNPLRFGSGVKGKILSSMEAGIPVVTTTIGNEGIGLQPDVEGLIADGADGLAHQVVRLFEDPAFAGRLAEGSRRAFEARFGRQRALDDLLLALGIAR